MRSCCNRDQTGGDDRRPRARDGLVDKGLGTSPANRRRPGIVSRNDAPTRPRTSTWSKPEWRSICSRLAGLKKRMRGDRHGCERPRSSPRGVHLPISMSARSRQCAPFGTVAINLPPGRRTRSVEAASTCGSSRCSNTSMLSATSKVRSGKGSSPSRISSWRVQPVLASEFDCVFGDVDPHVAVRVVSDPVAAGPDRLRSQRR